MKVVVGKITGTPLPGSWAQVVAFKPEAQPGAVRKKPLFVALDLQGPADFDVTSLGKEILSILEKDFFQIDKEMPFLALKRAVNSSFKHLENIISQDASSTEKQGELPLPEQEIELEFNLVAASISDGILYLAQLGGGQVWLWRKGLLGKILVEPASEVKLASGPIEPGDVAILGTPRFFKLVSSGELRAVLAGGEIEEAVDGLAPKVHAFEKSSTAAALFIKLEKEEVETDLELPSTQGMFRELSKPIYVYRQAVGVGKRRSLLLVAVVLITLLTLSVIKGIGRKDYGSRYGRLETLLTQAEEKYKMAASLSDLNPAVSRDLLHEAKKLLTEVEELKIKSDKFSKLSEDVASELAKVSKVFEVKQPEVFFDLTLIAKGTSGQAATFWESGVLVVDSQGKDIYKVDLLTRSGEVIASGEDLAGAKFISASFVFTPQGIFQLDTEGKRTRKVIEPGDWEKILGMSIYGGNIYLLDVAQNQIIKYTALEGGFSAPRNYLAALESPDFSNAQDLTIDGWIYVLKQDGTILKYLSGTQEFFTVTGLDPALSDLVALYTEPETDDLYILDQGGRRVVVLTKTGDYQSQYVSETLIGANDLVVDEENRAIYVLKESKIYKVEIRE